jgi:hypothetical protein
MLFNGTPKDILIISSKIGIWNGGSRRHGMHDKTTNSANNNYQQQPSFIYPTTCDDDNFLSWLTVTSAGNDGNTFLVYCSGFVTSCTNETNGWKAAHRAMAQKFVNS